MGFCACPCECQFSASVLLTLLLFQRSVLLGKYYATSKFCMKSSHFQTNMFHIFVSKHVPKTCCKTYVVVCFSKNIVFQKRTVHINLFQTKKTMTTPFILGHSRFVQVSELAPPGAPCNAVQRKKETTLVLLYGQYCSRNKIRAYTTQGFLKKNIKFGHESTPATLGSIRPIKHSEQQFHMQNIPFFPFFS